MPPSNAEATSPQFKMSHISVTLSTLDPSSYVLDELNKLSTKFSTNRRTSVNALFFSPDDATALTKNSPPAAIDAAIKRPTRGIEEGILRDRIWNFKLYRDSFVGREMVDWILEKFGDIDTREAACAFANELLEQGVFLHMNRRHRFLDGHYFYCLRTEKPPTPTEVGDAVNGAEEHDSGDISPVTVSGTEDGEESDSPVERPLADSTHTPKLGPASSVQWFLSKFGLPPLSNAEVPISSASPIKPRVVRREKIALVKSIGVDMDLQRRSGICFLGFMSRIEAAYRSASL